jgi:hypothetical protein
MFTYAQQSHFFTQRLKYMYGLLMIIIRENVDGKTISALKS